MLYLKLPLPSMLRSGPYAPLLLPMLCLGLLLLPGMRWAAVGVPGAELRGVNSFSLASLLMLAVSLLIGSTVHVQAHCVSVQ